MGIKGWPIRGEGKLLPNWTGREKAYYTYTPDTDSEVTIVRFQVSNIEIEDTPINKTNITYSNV